jgi:hypothetical protein
MSAARTAAMLAALAALATQAVAVGADTREWRFDVSLDGRPIGEHRYVLREHADSRELTSEASFRVRVLFFEAYRYDHRAQESWRGDCVEKLESRTDTNGEQTRVDAGPFDGCVQTFAYWNPSILEARRLLNPQTGEHVAVQVRDLGSELLAGQPVQRYRLTGSGATPLEIDLWYTPSREWVALESRTPEGRRLRYARKP